MPPTPSKETPRAEAGSPRSKRESDHLDKMWTRAYAAKSKKDLTELYDDWADSYDEDHATIGFFGHRTAARMLARYTPFAEVAYVLDAGCGTGAAGEALHSIGFRNLSGIDLSREMLAKAKQKRLYNHLSQADLSQPIDTFPCNHFDAAVLVGVFSYGQAPAHALDEIVRVVKPGGTITLTMRVDFFEQDAMGVRSKLEELDNEHAIKLLEATEPELYLPKKDPSALFRVWCYRVLETKTPPVDETFAAAVQHAFLGAGHEHRIDHSHIWNRVGSRLYDRYTECPSYYLTDSEVAILEQNATDILVQDRVLIELGCGSAKKVSHLLSAAIERNESEPLTYIPIDVSQGALESTKRDIDARFGTAIDVQPRCGRFDDVLASIPVEPSKLIVFFGSSIGNLENLEATVEFLRGIRDRLSPRDRFLVGMDLHKDEEVLKGAYEAGPPNHSFFLNMIRRMNRELGGNFDLSSFRQESPYIAEEPCRGIKTSTVKFRLVTERAQDVYLASMHMEVHLDEGDSIQVGTSRKFRHEDIARLGAAAGLRLERQWFDDRQWFSMNEFVRIEDAAPTSIQ
ncbi:MAG: L-histidine N(alpha)-methyltransferase [Planctomycetes bacterium]|nr:L-histidine N(alpha)-methyltransferase [Planctomycetota bacterium]